MINGGSMLLHVYLPFEGLYGITLLSEIHRSSLFPRELPKVNLGAIRLFPLECHRSEGWVC